MKLYLPVCRFSGGHTDSVNCAAFSAAGDLLATGSEDGSLAICSILTVVWDAHVPTRLFFGCVDGTAAYIDKSPGPIHLIKTGLYDVPVYALAVSGGVPNVALAAGPEVHIAARMKDNKSYATVIILPKPTSLSEPKSESLDVRGRSLHFLNGGSKLLVSYLNHGIVCWDMENIVQLWQIEPRHSHQYIGFATVSVDETYVAISNLSTGVDLYSLTSLELVHSFQIYVNPNTNVPVAVQFLQNGKLVTCGSHNGGVCIWERENGKVFQTLQHDVKLITSMAVHSKPNIELVATATTGAQPQIHLWRTESPNQSAQASILSRSMAITKELMGPLNKFRHIITLLIISAVFLIFAIHDVFLVHRTMVILYFSKFLEASQSSISNCTLWIVTVLRYTIANNLEMIRKVLWEWLQPPAPVSEKFMVE